MNTREALRAAFNEAYASLNAAQKAAVDTIDGPVMVIAGPGTGKTQILTLRIARILLETDIRPENILALTFTDAGAKAMRERLHRYIGAEAYRVAIFTFHGFAERLIREYPDAYDRVIGGRPASELDKVSIIETILDDPQFKVLRPMGDPRYYVSHLIRMISSLKKEYITPNGLREIIATQETELLGIEKIHQKGAHKGKVRGEYTKKEKDIAKNRELLSVYRLYEASLKDHRLYDFEDMIVETVSALTQKEDMLRDLQETYQYVLADEHQDVNGSQNKILELLCNFHDNPNVFVVGDEKQAIYRFQGASLENFLYFTDLFPGTKQISLTENYRSGQMILDAAHSLVAVEEGPLKDLRVPLTAVAVETAVVERRDFSHQAIEDTWVVKSVKDALAAGTAPEEVAIIVRTNREVEHLAALLRKEGVAVVASADGDILEHPITHTVQGFINAIVQSHEEGPLFRLLHGTFWGLPSSDLIKIVSARSYALSLAEILGSAEKLAELKVEQIAAAQNVLTTIQTARDRMSHEAPHRVLEYVLNQSGYLTYLMTHDPLEGGRVVRRLYDEVEKMVLYDNQTSLRDVSQVFNSYREHRLSLNAPYIATNENAVAVMTAHKSKGLEFSVVIVPHLIDSVWGGSAKRSYFDVPLTHLVDESMFDPIDDERRLLYVAMTRAKKSLLLSSSEQNTEGKEQVTSRLFDDIDEDFYTSIGTESEENTFSPLAQLKKQAANAAVTVELLRTDLERRGLSATSLNNYLNSPYDYLYRNVLRIPEVQAPALQFGTAIHGVMEWVSSIVAKSGVVPDINKIKAQLETQLGRLPITQNEFVRLHEKGLEALVVYLEHARQTLSKDAKVEFTINVRLATGLPEFPEVTLTGKLDRLDLDATGKVVRVVDYKTGNPKTRNEIEGKTQNSNGDYKRQLTFYALLLSLLDDERYACTIGVLSFIQPDKKGEVREETFEITPEEIESLKAEIIRVTKEIVTGSFLAVPCDPTTSGYCNLANEVTWH